MKSYDIVGDIHGCALTLEAMLLALGYEKDKKGVYKHAERQVVFLGDFIDRGPHQKKVISIVRAMIDSESAQSVMGNHEFNAIAYHADLREHSDKNYKQHKTFLDAYEGNKSEYDDVINWFKSLPLWLDLPGCRVIHACWDKEAIARIEVFQGGSSVLSPELLIEATNKTTTLYNDIETILKGKEISLPEGHHFQDKDGNTRYEIRIRWWDNNSTTYNEAFMGPESARQYIPDIKIPSDHSIQYEDEPPVFIGHYWMDNKPEPLTKNIVCVDYSVAKPCGTLAAYRWSGETILDKDKFVTVNRIEE